MLNRDSIIVRVIPSAKNTEWASPIADDILRVRIHAAPEKGKANQELLRFLREETGKNWEIIRGEHTRTKYLRQAK